MLHFGNINIDNEQKCDGSADILFARSCAADKNQKKMETQFLKNINSPGALQHLSIAELNVLSSEIRQTILETVSRTGGHLSSGLGVVELTIALHRVFHAPDDKILWDVGHQTYPHKLLTGRWKTFDTLRSYGGLNGFCKPEESVYDPFVSGHAGNAVSAAMGFAVANELSCRKDHVIAIVGDGGLGNGVTLEALNNLRATCKRLIVVLNDNKMSIDHSIGAIPQYLNRLITGRSYNRFKKLAKRGLSHFPGGKNMISGIQQLEASTKKLLVPGSFFEEMGIRYVGPIHGHDIAALIKTFDRIRDFDQPVLVHVITEKGHGCDYVAADPETYHGVGAFDPEQGVQKTGAQMTYSAAFGKALEDLAAADDRISVITAAMASGCGIPGSYIRKYPERFFDVGIAEEHALTFAGGLAAAGQRPVVALYATFLQRALGCLYHDICLPDLPVLLCLDRAGAVEDGPTHHGIYDLSYLLTMPNLSVLMPESEAVLKEMMHLAVKQSGPVAIRYPRGSSGVTETEDQIPVEWGRSVPDREGDDLAIWSCGRELYTARAVADILQEKYGISAAIHNVRFLKPFDEETFLASAEQKHVVTLEDHCVEGGFGALAARVLLRSGKAHHGITSFGWGDSVIPHGAVADLRKAAGLQPEQIAETIAEKMKK